MYAFHKNIPASSQLSPATAPSEKPHKQTSGCDLDIHLPSATVSWTLVFVVRIQDLICLVCYRSSVLQANMLLSPLTVKMKMREITPNRPLHSVLSPNLSPPWNIREQIKPLSRQDKIKLTISWRPFLTFFLKKHKMK